MLLNILPTDGAETVNVADSLKNSLHTLAEQVKEDPNQLINDFVQQAIDFGLKLVAAFVIYMLGAWAIRRIKKILKKLFEKRGTEKTIASFITSLTSISLTVLLVVITIGALGVNTTSLAAILAAGGMAVGMALSGTVQNFAGGIMILAFKPFKAGDYIKALGYEGFVTDVTIVSTKIRTTENSTIILPNGALSNGNIDNFSQKPIHRCVWKITVAYGSDPDKVRSLLMAMIKDDTRILDSKTEGAADPVVLMTAMLDSSIEFQLRVWVNTPDYWPVILHYNEEIYKLLPKNGVEFAFPQLDVHIKKD